MSPQNSIASHQHISWLPSCVPVHIPESSMNQSHVTQLIDIGHYNITPNQRIAPLKQPLSFCNTVLPLSLLFSISTSPLSNSIPFARRTFSLVFARRMPSGINLACSPSAFHCARLSRLGTVRYLDEGATWQ